MPIAAVPSDRRTKRACKPKSRNTANIPRPSAAPRTTTASSASPENRAIVGWVWDQVLRHRWPQNNEPPPVDLRVAAQPAKSAAT
eukprot:427836-Lingulodinium_polyedra.AAC.1